MGRTAEQLSFDALAGIRTSAEKWAATVASILAIFSVVALIKGPEDITKVQDDLGVRGWLMPDRFEFDISFEHMAVFFVAVAIGFAILATTSAAVAAYGLPKDFRFTGEKVRELYREEAKEAALQLWRARWSAVFAVVFLGLAVGITWLATPDKSEPGSSVLVVRTVGRPVCGALQASRRGTVQILEKGSKEPRAVDVDEVVAMTAVAACPGED